MTPDDDVRTTAVALVVAGVLTGAALPVAGALLVVLVGVLPPAPVAVAGLAAALAVPVGALVLARRTTDRTLRHVAGGTAAGVGAVLLTLAVQVAVVVPWGVLTFPAQH